MQYAQMLASRSPLSHRFAKEVVKRTVGMHMDEALRLESRSFHDVARHRALLSECAGACFRR